MKKASTNNGRRHLSGVAFGQLGFCTPWAIDKNGGGQEWLEVVNVELKLAAQHGHLAGKRLVHISDLHCSKTVSSKYLHSCMERVNRLEPDAVMLTGDYITVDSRGTYSQKVAEVMGSLRAKEGVFACMGNHDYGVHGLVKPKRHRRLFEMIDMMEQSGVRVLRNNSAAIELDGKPAWIVGLGDIWARDLDADRAFGKVGGDGPVFVLAHNPETVEAIGNYRHDIMLSGHTHGIQYQFSTPFFGKSFINRLRYDAGLYRVNQRYLYVNRGLGRLGRVLFNARPEITVFTLAC